MINYKIRFDENNIKAMLVILKIVNPIGNLNIVLENTTVKKVGTLDKIVSASKRF